MFSLRSKIMRINSKERDSILSASSSDIVIKYNPNNPTVSQIHSIAFKSCGIPNTVNNIDDTNNLFLFSSGGVQFGIPLLSGNYNITTLISNLVNSAPAIAVGMNIVVDPITGKLEFSFTTPSKLLPLSLGNKLATVLGIGEDGSLIDVPLWLAPNLPSLIGLQNIYIACNELSGGDYMLDPFLGQLNVFAHIPVDVGFGLVQHYISPDQDSDLILFPSDRNLDYLTIKLYDDRGKILDLQGLDWQMILKVFYHTNSTK